MEAYDFHALEVLLSFVESRKGGETGIREIQLLFGDAFKDISIPAHLVTLEFHGEVAARLTDAGFYAVNVVDGGARPRFLFSLVKTLEQTFATVEVWLEREQVDSPGRVTYTVLGAAKPTPVGRVTAAYGLQRTWVRWPAATLRAAIAGAAAPVLTDDFAPVDRLMMHVLFAPDN